MAINNYVSNHKTWDHVGTVTPDIEISEGIRPAEELKPAAWLPVQRYDKHYEEYFVVSAGKVVALDNAGDLVPAQYATSTTDIIYTQNDIDEGTLDVRTGLPVTATATFAVSTVDGTPGFLGGSDALAVSAPVGIAPYNYWQWAGGDGVNPSQYRKHNHNLQHQVAILCDYYIELPLVPAVQAAEALDNASQVGSLSVYSFIAVDNIPMAKNTARTALTFAEGAGVPGDVATRFQNEVATLADVVSAGDYFVNYTTGIVSVYATLVEVTGGALADTDYTMAYYHYASAPASVGTYACAVGDLKAGDFVMADGNSNMAFWTEASDDWSLVLGQVLARDSGFPKDALERVKTAYAGLGVEEQMPGTANGGVPANISYAGAANTVVRINLINR